MNKIPLTFDSSLLIGTEVEMICFNSTQIYMHFENQTSLTIECSYCINSSVQLDIHTNKSESFFVELIGEKIVSLAVDKDRLNLSITFSNSNVLKLINNEYYESFTFKFPDGIQIF